MPIRYSSFVISEITVLYIDALTITFCLLVHYDTIFIFLYCGTGLQLWVPYGTIFLELYFIVTFS